MKNMTNLKDRILCTLYISKYHLDINELTYILGQKRKDVASALFYLQDTDDVILRNGFYRLSEKSRKNIFFLSGSRKNIENEL